MTFKDEEYLTELLEEAGRCDGQCILGTSVGPEIRESLSQLKQAGYIRVVIDGDNMHVIFRTMAKLFAESQWIAYRAFWFEN